MRTPLLNLFKGFDLEMVYPSNDPAWILVLKPVSQTDPEELNEPESAYKFSCAPSLVS